MLLEVVNLLIEYFCLFCWLILIDGKKFVVGYNEFVFKNLVKKKISFVFLVV